MAKVSPSTFNNISTGNMFGSSANRRKTRRGKKKGRRHRHRGKFVDVVMDISVSLSASKCVGCKRDLVSYNVPVLGQRNTSEGQAVRFKLCGKCRRLFPAQQLWSESESILALNQFAESSVVSPISIDTVLPCFPITSLEDQVHESPNMWSLFTQFEDRSSSPPTPNTSLEFPATTNESHEPIYFGEGAGDNCFNVSSSKLERRLKNCVITEKAEFISTSKINSSFDSDSFDDRTVSFEEFLLADFEAEYAKCQEDEAHKLSVTELVERNSDLRKKANCLDTEISKLQEFRRLLEENQKLLAENEQLKQNIDLS